MNILRIIRSSEWWEYKLPPLLAIGYATVYSYGIDFFKAISSIIFLIAAIISGAIYVSIINDITDLKEDAASGKFNRLRTLAPAVRWLFLTLSLVPGFVFMYFLSGDILSLSVYILSYISFSLYSIPPFRLKSKGLPGVLADACGAHLFPSLLFVCGLVYLMKVEINWMWFTAVGVWAFFYGLRGILWHQFLDRDNDLKIGLRTYATQHDPSLFKTKAAWILAIECAAVMVMLLYIAKPLPLLALLFYLIFLLVYYKKSGMKIIIIIPPAQRYYHIAMSRYYDVFLPLSLLFTFAYSDARVLMIIVAHVILFPQNLKSVIFQIITLAKKFTPKWSA